MSKTSWKTKRSKPPNSNCHHLLKFVHLHMVLEGMSMSELSRRAGYTPDYLGKLFAGTRTIRLEGAKALLGVFDYTLKTSPINNKESKS